MANTSIKSYDQLVEKLSVEGKKKADATRTKVKKEAELSGQVSTAKINLMDAEAALEEAIITDGKSIAEAAAKLERAQRDYTFYQELYAAVFPNV